MTGSIISDPETVVPERPANVPASAVWHEASKGGNFYEVVEIEDDIHRIRVYFDYGEGELYMDSDFKLEPIAITKDNYNFTSAKMTARRDCKLILNVFFMFFVKIVCYTENINLVIVSLT